MLMCLTKMTNKHLAKNNCYFSIKSLTIYDFVYHSKPRQERYVYMGIDQVAILLLRIFLTHFHILTCTILKLIKSIHINSHLSFQEYGNWTDFIDQPHCIYQAIKH